jgi:DNA polymerase-3 subunit gamma/tau
VLSRVQRFDFTRLSVDQIAGKLDRILVADGRTAEPGAVQLVARLAAGGMRDAESILDQVLASGDDLLTEARVGDLLGLVDAETVTAFLDALVRGQALTGLAAIDGLEERGRDLHVFLDQVVDAVRLALTGQLGGSAAAWPLADLVAVARRLAAIDPSRASIGGLRFQLELALLEGSAEPVGAPVPVPAPRPVPAPAAPPVAAPVRAGVKADEAGDPVMATQAPAKVIEPSRSAEPEKPARTPAPAKLAKPADGVEAAVAAEPGAGLIELTAAWPRIVAELSSSPPIKPLIEACRPIDMAGNQVVLGFPEGKAFLRDVAERRRPHLEEGIGRVLGRAVAVRLVATNLDLLPAPVPAEVDMISMARRVWADEILDADEIR